MKKNISDKVSMIASCFSISVGIDVLIGWWFDISLLKSVAPGGVHIMANTALCFILTGVALWLLRHEKPGQLEASVARACAWMVVAIACLTLAEYVFGLDFGINQMLFRPESIPNCTKQPVRMAHTTAFSFMMLGFALLLSRRNLKIAHFCAQLSALLVGFIGLLAMIGYFYEAQPLYTFGLCTKMALHTAITFFALSAGILSLSPDSGLIAILASDRVGGAVARRLLPVAIGLTILLGWLHLKGEQMELYGNELGLAILVSAMILVFTALIVWTASSMNRADAEHTEAELQYNTILSTAIDGFWITDMKGRILDVNEAYCRMIGYTREELLTMRVQDLEAAESPQETARHITRMRQDGRDRFETRHRRKDGAIIDIDAAVQFTALHDGVFSVFIRDITGRKQEESAMRESRQQLLLAEASILAVVETAVDGIITIDENGIIETFNLAAERIFGYAAEEIAGQNVNILMPPQYAEKHDAYIKRYLSSGKKHIIGIGREAVGKRKDGSLLPIHLSVSEARLPDRRIFTGLVRDLTEQKRSEELLRESEKKFRAIFDGANDGMFLVDLETRKFILCNTSCSKMLGYAKEEFVRLDIANIHPTEDLPVIFEQIKKMASGEESTPGEIRFKRKDGRVFFADISATLIILGGKSSILVVFRDITGRRHTEEIIQTRLRLTEFSASHSLDELLQKALDEIGKLTDSPIGFYHFVEPDQQTLSLQAWSTRTLQEFCTAEGKGLHYNLEKAGVWVDCVHQREAVIHNDYASLPHRRGMPSGHAAVTRELIAPIFRNDKIVAIVGVGNKPENYTSQDVGLVTYLADIAWELIERKRTELALKKAEQRYRNLAESLPQLTWTCRADGPCDYLSPQWVAYTGIPEAEQLGYGWSKQLHPDDWPHVQTTWMESVKTGAPYDIEYRIRRADGAYRWFETRAIPLRNKQGEIVKWLGLNLDVDDAKQAEQKLQIALTDLRRSNEELEQFAYVASHDLQEPLRMVSSYTQLLAQHLEDKLDEKARKYIGYAVDGALRMQILINDLLIYSRIETRGRPIKTTDSHSALGEAIRNLTAGIHESLALITNDDLPAVRADSTQLTQVFQNLIANAIKFRRPEEPPRIHVSVARQESGIGRAPAWRFGIHDNGIGIDSKYKDRLFIIFQRLHTRQEYSGTGIGLALCKRIVERHGGKIWFESEPGKGSVFYFTMPE